MSEFAYAVEVGKFRDKTYQMGTKADPSLNAAMDPSREASWAVVLYYEKADGERIQVARIDNTEHEGGTIHIDRLYREERAERKDFDIDVNSYSDAEDYLTENWRHYARQHQENFT